MPSFVPVALKEFTFGVKGELLPREYDVETYNWHKRPAWYTIQLGQELEERPITRIELCSCGKYPLVWCDSKYVSFHYCKDSEQWQIN